MKNKNPNILVNNKAEFKQSLAHFFRNEKEVRDETHVGLKILFEINPPKFEYSNFDHNCRTKIVAKIVDDVTFRKFWKNACIHNETFTFKRVDVETREQYDELLKMEEKLNNIASKEYEISKSIQELIKLMDEEALKFAANDLDVWKGAIGHIKRKISLYADTIPTFDLLESDLTEEDEEEMVFKVFETTKTELSGIEQSFVQPKPILIPDATKEEWLKAIDSQKDFYNKNGRTILMDEEIINAAKGFFLGPVGVFNNKVITAETQKFDNLYEMRIFLINVQCKTKDMILYVTYEDKGVYYWRGVFVDKE